ncbi:hypothetical protein MLD38_037654 [Melastoma candidum]|uniref:Uncharacterized protein n=1 Tax=Melastoma candidum TaxID=119954 RepID=A0ACB9LNI3_9MYRT|nr:hypothetical protein MLD38_037654 [Melastoma candidum]
MLDQMKEFSLAILNQAKLIEFSTKELLLLRNLLMSSLMTLNTQRNLSYLTGQDANFEGPSEDNDSDKNLLDRVPTLYKKRHPMEQVIGDVQKGIQTRRSVNLFCEHSAFLSQKEPTSIDEALADPNWIIAMLCGQEQGQTRGQRMDVKSAFLNGEIKEEVYVDQPPGFEDPKNHDHVYKLDNALYGLKQAPRAWYERLSQFLIEKGYRKGKVDTTLFLKKHETELLIVQIYVDDIIFGSTNNTLCNEFAELMKGEFEMSMVGELTFFLGLQIRQTSKGTFIHQEKYTKQLLKKYELTNSKHLSTPMSTNAIVEQDESGKDADPSLYRSMIGSLLYLTASRPDILFSVCLCARYQSAPKESHLTHAKRIFRYLSGTTNLGLWYSKRSSFDLIGYSDADFAGCKIDRKSTSGTCQLLGDMLISWHSKNQASIALSTAEAEYVAAASCCAQLLWMRQKLEDYGFKFDNIPIRCDYTSAINLTKNPVQHSMSKHTELRHHFIRDHVQNGSIAVEYVSTETQLCDIFTKPLNFEKFSKLRMELGICYPL